MLLIRKYWQTFIAEGFGQKIKLARNSFLYHQGGIGDGFYYLAEGEVKISILSNQGKERDLDYVMPGELLGEQGMNSTPYFTTARTTTPTVLYYFSREDFSKLCLTFPEAAEIFMNSLIFKIRLLADATVFLNAPAEIRLARFLYSTYEQKQQTKIHLSQVSLARFIGTSRITVYKIMKEWQARGLVAVKKGTIEIRNAPELATLIKTHLDQPSTPLEIPI